MESGPGRDTGASAAGFPFVGRRRELDRALAALARRPAVLLVEGEAGLGKSRLVHETVAALSAQDSPVLVGYCQPLREPIPFGPVVDALRKAGPWLPPAAELPPAVGALAPLLPDLADRLPPPPSGPEDAQTARNRLVQAVRSFLGVLGRAVLVVEDMHWVDEATRDLLLLLARDLPADLGVLLTYRAEDLPPGSHVLGSAYRRAPGTYGDTIVLGPLTIDDVGALASAALGPEAGRRLAPLLLDRSEGLPLVVEEDLLTLREYASDTSGTTTGGPAAGGTGGGAAGGPPGGMTGPAAPGGVAGPGTGSGPGGPGSGGATADPTALAAVLERAGVPRGARQAVSERLENLSPAGSAITDAAAVLAVPGTEALLTEIAGLPPDQGAGGLTQALRSFVLEETAPAQYAFRHVLAQQAAYERIPGPARRRLHQRALDALQAQVPPPLIQIAHHTLALGDRRAWPARAEAAADQAIAVGDAGTALTLLHEILAQPELPRDLRGRAALALARIAAQGIDTERNTAVLTRLLADPDLPLPDRGEIRLSLGLLMVGQAGLGAGYRHLEIAVEELADKPARAVRAMTALALDEREGTQLRARGWLDRADAVLGEHPDAAASAAVLAARVTLLARDGDGTVWGRLAELPRGTEDTEVLTHTTRALYNVGDLAIELGHDERAADLLSESRELCRRAGHQYLDFYIGIDLLRLVALAGRWTEFERRFATLAGAIPDLAMASDEQALTGGMLATARGQHDRALELFAAASEAGRAEGQVTILVRAAAGTALVHLAGGRPREAWDEVRPAVAALRGASAWARGGDLICVAVEAALACGEPEAARALTEETARELEHRDAPAAAAGLEVARGLLLREDDPAGAAAAFARARAAWHAMGRPYEESRAAERHAQALSAADPATAAEVIGACADTYTHLGATSDLARCRSVLRELGLAAEPSRGRRGYGQQLSPREREVAGLVADGLSNQAIAQALFLSPRTVEHHVARVLSKLGVERGAVGAALRDGADPGTGGTHDSPPQMGSGTH